MQILQKLWEKIIIPEAVYREVVEEGAGKPGAEIVSAACNKWITVTPVSNANEVKVLRAMLDAGESEVIVLGQELKAQLLLLDNREPRLFANELNLNINWNHGYNKARMEKGLNKRPGQGIAKTQVKGFLDI